MSIKFSIIIPTFKHHVSLSRLIRNLSHQDYYQNSFEVIIVSNDSESLKYCKKLNEGLKSKNNFRFIHENISGASAARNMGIKNAYNNFLIFLDDDVQIKSDFLSEYEKTWLINPNATIIGGKVDIKIIKNQKPNEEQKQLLKKFPWCFGIQDLGEKDRLLGVGDILYSNVLSYKVRNSNKCFFHNKLGRPFYGLGRIGAEDYELTTREILKKNKVQYVANKKLIAKVEVSLDRITEKYVLSRHFAGGIELCMLERYIKEKFPYFKCFYINSYKNYYGWLNLIFNKYERTMFLSYLTNKYLLFNL